MTSAATQAVYLKQAVGNQADLGSRGFTPHDNAGRQRTGKHAECNSIVTHHAQVTHCWVVCMLSPVLYIRSGVVWRPVSPRAQRSKGSQTSC